MNNIEVTVSLRNIDPGLSIKNVEDMLNNILNVYDVTAFITGFKNNNQVAFEAEHEAIKKRSVMVNKKVINNVIYSETDDIDYIPDADNEIPY